MFGNKYSKSFLSYFLGIFIANCIIFGQVRAGDGGTAGNADFDIRTGVYTEREMIQMDKPFDPMDLRMAPALRGMLKTAELLPGFNAAVRKTLAKTWVFTHESFENCKTELDRFIDPYSKTACQNAGAVKLDRESYTQFTAPSGYKMSEPAMMAALNQNQIDLLAHQLCLGPVLGTGVSTVALSKCVEVLTSGDYETADQIQAAFESSGYGIFGDQSHCGKAATNQDVTGPIESLNSVAKPVLNGAKEEMFIGFEKGEFKARNMSPTAPAIVDATIEPEKKHLFFAIGEAAVGLANQKQADSKR